MANEKRIPSADEIRIAGLCGKAVFGQSTVGNSALPDGRPATLIEVSLDQILAHELPHGLLGHPAGYVGYDSKDGKPGLLDSPLDPARRFTIIESPDIVEPRTLINLLAGPDDPAADALLKRISEE